MDINRQNLADLHIGYNSAFNTGFRSANLMWDKIATPVPSTTGEEHYAWLGQMPRMRKWVGERVLKQMASHDYRIKNVKFESTVPVPRDHIEDDTYGVYNPMMQEMGYGAATHPEELVFGLLAMGFTGLCYDGQPFFDADHPVGRNKIVSRSNYQDGNSTPWFIVDASRPLKPLIFQKRRDYDFRSITDKDAEHVFMRDEYVYGVDARVNVGYGFWQQAFGSKAELNAENFNAALTALQTMISDEGRPMGIQPTHLVVPPTLRSQAKEIIEAERNANGATNINRNAVEIINTPWLAAVA